MNYLGLYEVSNWARVRSVARWIAARDGRRLSEGRILAQSLKNNGYWAVVLCDRCHEETISVHRLVAGALVTWNRGSSQAH